MRSIFRQFHTLKGEGAICGIKSVADFCHGIETEIEDARSGGLILTDAIVAILQELAAILRPILAGKSRESIGEELIQSLMDELREGVVKAKELQHAGGTEKQDDASGGEDKFADFFAGFEPPPPREETPGTDAAGMIDMEDAVSATVPDAASGKASAEEFLDALFADTGSPGTAEADATSLADPGKGASNVAADNGEDDAPVTAALQKEGVEKRVEDNKVKAISVDVHRLDELLEIVGEVSLIGSYVTSRLHGNEELSLQTTNLLRACGRLQEAANSMRMTSIRPLFMTVRRAAVDAARVSRKLIDIDMEGIDTQVDRSIVESLSAALIHIIRNAVDHGIEPADVRRRSGKPERGAIRISASRTNSDIVIELGDDGRGLDLRAIRDKAVAMGKLLPDAALTNEELADLVFLPGLSTARAVTGLSGRGVGMEIVRDSIDSLRGKVALRTEEGQGTTVRMRFPLVVAAMDAMLVRVGANILALPVAQVRECFRPAAKDIGSIENRGTIVTIRGVILPVLFLGREFGIAGEAQAPEDGVLVVVETGEMLTAVLVDETIGSTQVVIRALEGPLAQSPLVAGAAILPDGRIGLVIETTRLTERVATTATKAFNDAGMRQAESSRQVDTVSIGANQVGMIDFTIAAPGGNGSTHSHVFAINAFKTREFVPLTQLHAIPNSPPVSPA